MAQWLALHPHKMKVVGSSPAGATYFASRCDGRTQDFGSYGKSSILLEATMMKRRKYGNTKCEFNGIAFDSIKEKDRYIVLKEAENKGLISNLELQPEFELIPKITEQVIKHLKTKDKVVEKFVQHPITYRADFSYIKDGVRVVEDVKISPKMLPQEFKLKMKMVRYFHNISIKLVYKPTAEI